MEQRPIENRQIHLDCIRILAILLVLFNHTGTYGFFRFSQTASPLLYWLYMIPAILCTMGVPLFFMISGALLIPREESLSTLYRKRVLRMLLVLVLFSLIQWLYLVYVRHQEISPASFFQLLYSEQIIPPYWFLYTYLGALIMLPFIRRMAGNMTRKEFSYLLWLYLIFVGILPIVQYLFLPGLGTLNIQLPLVTTTSIFFFVLGHVCNNVLTIEEITKKRLLLLFFASVCAVAVSALLTDDQARQTGILNEAQSQTFLAFLSVVPAMTLFLFLRKWSSGHPCCPKAATVLHFFSDGTFGAYLFHAIFMDQLMPLLYGLQEKIDTFPACLVYVVCVYLCGVALTWLLKRIPALRRLI